MTTEHLEYLGLDRRLGNRDRRVYLILTAKLNDLTPVPVKVVWVARMLSIDKKDASQSLRRLVDTCYLERCGRDGIEGPYLYRLHPAYGEEGVISPTCQVS